MRVNAAAAAGAILATLLAVVGNAAHPAQVAAGGAFLGVLSLGRRAAPGGWLTVQMLLAGNLVVFGISDAHQLEEYSRR